MIFFKLPICAKCNYIINVGLPAMNGTTVITIATIRSFRSHLHKFYRILHTHTSQTSLSPSAVSVHSSSYFTIQIARFIPIKKFGMNTRDICISFGGSVFLRRVGIESNSALIPFLALPMASRDSASITGKIQAQIMWHNPTSKLSR